MAFDRRSIPAGATIGEWRAPDGWLHRTFAWPAESKTPLVPSPSTPPVGVAQDKLQPAAEVEGRGSNARETPFDFAQDERKGRRGSESGQAPFDYAQDERKGGRGSILFLGGRGDIFEKYLETFDHWRRAGWSIGAFDWRGQGGSGRLSADPMCGHATDFSVWIDDLAAYFEQWRATHSAPHVIIGHSMGGHLTLRALAERRIAPDAVVLVAAMLGLKSAPFGARFAARVAWLMTKIGAPERLAWKANERPGLPGVSRLKLLTHDADRYADELWWKAEKPEIAVGPPSWAWVAEAYRSTLALEAPGRLEAVTTPLLLLGADTDRLVDPQAIRRAAARLPNAKLRMWGPESAHEILREADPVRDAALAAIAAFLDANAPQG